MFRSLARVGVSVETAMARSGVPPHVKAFVARTMAVADSGSTEEVLAELFYDREDIIPDMFRRLQTTLHDARRDSDSLRHFSYYIDRHIEVDGDSHGPKGRCCLKIVSRTRHRVTIGLFAPRAIASTPESTFGMAH